MSDLENDSIHDLGSDFWDGTSGEDDCSEDEATSSDLRGSTSKRRRLERRCLISCHICSRPFKSMEGYKNHLNLHRLDELMKQSPMEDAIRTECQNIIKEVIEGIAEEESSVPLTKEINNLSGHLLQSIIDHQLDFINSLINEVVVCVCGLTSTSLSAFDASVKRGVNAVLANAQKRTELIAALKTALPVEISDSAGHCTIALVNAHIIRKLSVNVEAFILRALREPYELKLFGDISEDSTSRDNSEETSFQQTVYYIGGSTVCSVMKLGLRSKDVTWKNVIECIKKKLLVGDLASAPVADVVSWTESVNRGGLKFISEALWSFLMAISSLLCKLEGCDGSLLHDSVLKAVKDDDILIMLWDDVVGDSLNSEDSEFLLTKVCMYFTNTWGAGIVLRRKNGIVNQARDKNPLRASLLTRK